MPSAFDVLIVGTGFSGAVLAERCNMDQCVDLALAVSDRLKTQL
jgi:UDP-galactopyranose mutase